MTVDLSQLDGWAEMVDRAGRDLEAIGANASRHLVHADFGPILALMTGSFNALTSQVNQTLTQDGSGVREHARALQVASRDFADTEDSVVALHQGRGVDGRDGVRGFSDVVDTTVPAARPTEGELPHVSFGFPYDTVCDLVRMLTGFDVRAELAEQVGGDVVGASTQGSACSGLGTAIRGVTANLEAGSRTVARSWTGSAADAALASIGTWTSALDAQAGRLVQVGQNLVTVCRNAWETATSVVECITSAVRTVSSALATMSIPGVGWARVVQAVYQAFQALMKAFTVLKKFFAILESVTDYIEQVKGVFDKDALPSADAGSVSVSRTAPTAMRLPQTPVVGSTARTVGS
ncbi:hypothetical protein ASG94_12600 [Nocardioides sp. Soil805]|nr:hypothetical protein ASG94_12600 [Nocardioides sp. Soil805]